MEHCNYCSWYGHGICFRGDLRGKREDGRDGTSQLWFLVLAAQMSMAMHKAGLPAWLKAF